MRGATELCTQQFKFFRSAGCFNLLASVVHQAVLDADEGCIPSKLKSVQTERLLLAEQALAWIGSKSKKPWSFIWCCEFLGICHRQASREVLSRCLRKVAELRRRWAQVKKGAFSFYEYCDWVARSDPDSGGIVYSGRHIDRHFRSRGVLGRKKQPRAAVSKQKQPAARKAA
jgi:hypothetical protein